ncbi:MAG TPA: hypothetical protein VGW34_03205 [Allosphingosinicella sp.]|nr:hypothetical protein [Allosphingosinicella sp.]
MTDFPSALDLATLAADGFRIEGAGAYDGSGYSVASAGDVNGDGFDDIVIGALHKEFGHVARGGAWVVFGSGAGFGAGVDLTGLDGSNGFSIADDDGDDNGIGFAVASAGDLNGDGFADIVVGEYGNRYQQDPRGEIHSADSYVVFGSGAGFPGTVEIADLGGDNGFRIDGVEVAGRSSGPVASTGDVNGDGYDDLIVGAPFASNYDGLDFQSVAGESFLLFGSGEGFPDSLDLDALDPAAGIRIIGVDSADQSGFAVASAGDVNGDGMDDILIGAPAAHPGVYGDPREFAGEAYLVFGSDSGFADIIDLDQLDGSNGFEIPGFATFDNLGHAVASAGDVNGDGFDDIIVGAPGGDAGRDYYRDNDIVRSSGLCYLIFGSGGGFPATVDPETLDGANGFRIEGVGADDSTGFSVASAGDLNGDGFDDLLIGGTQTGLSYVVFGSGKGFDPRIDLAGLDGSDGFRIDGSASDNSGRSVAAAGDVNGDGFDDLVIGAPDADPAGSIDAGESYIIFGRAPASAVSRVGSAAGQTIRGGAFNDALSGLGGNDLLDGDGGNDRLIGGAGNDSLAGGGGSDTASYASAAAGVAVSLALTSFQDTLAAGRDRLLGIENLTGSAWADRLAGNDGANRLAGGSGDDQLAGLGGNDLLEGGDGNDRLAGGAGIDQALYAAAAAGVVVNLALATAQNTRGAGRDTLASIEQATGSAHADRLLGSGTANRLDGGAGADRLEGAAGNDALLGGAGDDLLVGGAGRDTMTGGTGADIWSLDDGDAGPLRGGADLILDFTRAQGDRISLRVVDADGAAAGDQNFRFIGTDAFSGVAGELRYQAIRGDAFLQGDVNGDGLADFFVRIEGVTEVFRADIIL